MSDPPSPVTDADFARFCEFLYRRTGMLFTPAKRYFVDRRLSERMQATGSRSFAVYLACLRADTEGEVENLINAFTINETYFYREDYQLRCLTSSILPEVVADKTPGSTVRIWSMPCSTGEEPYSVALWLLENWPEVDRHDVEIVVVSPRTVASPVATWLRMVNGNVTTPLLPSWASPRELPTSKVMPTPP